MEPNAKQIEDMARKGERELAAGEVKSAYLHHMQEECVSRGYNFAEGARLSKIYLQKAVAFSEKYGAEWHAVLNYQL